MLLAIDVGNTHTVLGLFRGEEIVDHWRIATDARRTADELAVVVHGLVSQRPTPYEVSSIALCSTVPSVLHEMREMCRRYYSHAKALIVEPGVRTGVPVLTDNPKEVGTDRIINSLAAMHIYGGPAIVSTRHGDDIRRGVDARGVPRRRDRARHRDLRRRTRRAGSAAAQGRRSPARGR
jgi:type III pantothenate kinase